MANKEQVSIELPGDLGDIVSFFSRYNLTAYEAKMGGRGIYLYAAGCSTPLGDRKSFLRRDDGIVKLCGDSDAVNVHYHNYLKHLGMLPEALKADAKAEAEKEPAVR